MLLIKNQQRSLNKLWVLATGRFLTMLSFVSKQIELLPK